MNKEAILRKGIRLLPNGMRDYARMVYRRGKHWAHPDLKGFGTVQDLYYWVADGQLDTIGSPAEVITESLVNRVFRVHTSITTGQEGRPFCTGFAESAQSWSKQRPRCVATS